MTKNQQSCLQLSEKESKLQTLSALYSKATWIPESDFVIDEFVNSNLYQVRSTLDKLPVRCGTVSSIGIENGKWWEIFNEEQLNRALKSAEEINQMREKLKAQGI